MERSGGGIATPEQLQRLAAVLGIPADMLLQEVPMYTMRNAEPEESQDEAVAR